MPTIEELRSFIALCAQRMTALGDALGADETRSTFTDAEQAEFDQLDRWVSDAKDLIERQERIERAVAAGQTEPGSTRIPNVNVNRNADPFDLSTLAVTSTPAEYRARALTAVEQIRTEVPAAHLEAAVATLRSDNPRGDIAKRYLATGSEEYRSAFGKLITGRSHLLTPEEAAAVERAASLTDASGGYAVPFLLDPTVILTSSGTANPFRMISRIVRGTSDAWNGVSSAGVTASWDGEAAEVSDDAPTLAQPSVTAHKAQAFIPFSIEAGQDWQNLESEAAVMFIDAKDTLEGAAFATGSGSSQPYGIVTDLVAASRTTASAGSNTFAVGDVDSVIEAVGPRFRRNGSWVANLAILNEIRAFGTTDARFTVNMTEAAIPALLGRPVYESSDLDGTYGSGENYVLVFGDFQHYVVYDRVGMSVELIPHLFATQNNRPSGQRGFYAHWRVGGKTVNTSAFTVLNVT